jgi:multisubunit Na+/H+ antiporter MnhC subunit
MAINDPPRGSAPPPSAADVAPGYAVVVPVWRRQHGLVTALTVLLVLDVLAGLFAIGALANRLAFINDVESLDFGVNVRARANEVDDLAQAAGITMIVLSLATVVVFIIWMFRAARNNAGLGREHPRLGPGWAIGGWFIPLANLVIPVLVMQDLWRGSTASIPRGDMRWKIADRSALVGWWWAALLLSLLQGAVDTEDPETTLSDLRAADTLSIVGTCFRIVAAVLAILVVRKLTERQEECLRVQHAEWSARSGAPPPPTAPSPSSPAPAPPPAPPSAPPPGS